MHTTIHNNIVVYCFFFFLRAKFDMFLHAIDSRKKVPEQTYVHCNFCSSPVSPSLLSSRSIQSGGSHMRFGGRGQSTLKVTRLFLFVSIMPKPRLSEARSDPRVFPTRVKSRKSQYRYNNVLFGIVLPDHSTSYTI